MLVAPRDTRKTLLRLIDEEIARSEQGRIILKMNGLDDVGMIEALYGASRAGVTHRLDRARSFPFATSAARFSENIRLISIVGRFLEHDRIWYFHNSGQPRVYLLDAALTDNRSAWELRADGRYLLRQPPSDGPCAPARKYSCSRRVNRSQVQATQTARAPAESSRAKAQSRVNERAGSASTRFRA